VRFLVNNNTKISICQAFCQGTSNSHFATESTEDTEENCRGLIYQALSLKNLSVGFDESVKKHI